LKFYSDALVSTIVDKGYFVICEEMLTSMIRSPLSSDFIIRNVKDVKKKKQVKIEAAICEKICAFNNNK